MRGRESYTSFVGDSVLPVPALAPHGGEGLPREHPRSWGGRPGPSLDSGIHSRGLLERGRCCECSHSSSIPK